MVDLSKNLALYPLLQHYVGSQVTSIISKGEILSFNTLLGDRGELSEEDNGDWRIMINHKLVEIIEKDVFQTLINPSKKVSLNSYLNVLRKLEKKKSISYRSSVLVGQIIKVLEEYVINSEFIPKKPIRAGIFLVLGAKDIKCIHCLN